MNVRREHEMIWQRPIHYSKCFWFLYAVVIIRAILIWKVSIQIDSVCICTSHQAALVAESRYFVTVCENVIRILTIFNSTLVERFGSSHLDSLMAWCGFLSCRQGQWFADWCRSSRRDTWRAEVTFHGPPPRCHACWRCIWTLERVDDVRRDLCQFRAPIARVFLHSCRSSRVCWFLDMSRGFPWGFLSSERSYGVWTRFWIQNHSRRW